MDLNVQLRSSFGSPTFFGRGPFCGSAFNTDADEFAATRSLSTVEWVPTLGMCPSCLVPTINEHVLLDGQHAEVVRINTSPISAPVVDHQPLRDFAMGRIPGDSVSPSSNPSKVKCPVSIPIQSQSPHPAPVLIFGESGVECCEFLVSKVLHRDMYTGRSLVRRGVPG